MEKFYHIKGHPNLLINKEGVVFRVYMLIVVYFGVGWIMILYPGLAVSKKIRAISMYVSLILA